MSAFIELALGMILIFLFASLIVTAIQEAVAALFSLRAKSLEGTLKALLNGSSTPGATTTPFDTFKKNPLIQSLYNINNNRAPSYIPARSFALAVLDMAKTTSGTVKEVKSWASGSDSGEIGKIVNSLITDTNQELATLQKNIESWFDETMDRLTGWYKRWTQATTIVFGILAAVTFNIDSIKVWDALSSQPQLREAAAAYAAKMDKAPASFETLVPQFEKLRFPIGWKDADDWTRWSILGWLITALAASLGSAFWFDLLKRFVQIRGAGPKPSVAEAQADPGTATPGTTPSTMPRAAFMRDRA